MLMAPPHSALTTGGWTTLGQASGFPNIGGAFAVAGFDSPNCGTCWELTFNGTKSITILALDTAPVVDMSEDMQHGARAPKSVQQRRTASMVRPIAVR